ncbi:alanine dehydrogenase [soil metagenome]
MIVGVPTELKNHEYRVALTPAGARELTSAGHQVLVETGAGAGSRITDEEYVRAGSVMTDVHDLWGRSDMVLKVKEPVADEFVRMRAGQILFTYLHLAASRAVTDAMLVSGIAGVAYETVQDSQGRLPLLAPMSEVAGRMAPQVGATLLEKEHGGRGILLGGVSGVHPAKVIVLGAGMAGANAAWLAQGMEAEVLVLDRSIDRLRYIDSIHKGRILTLMSNQTTIEDSVMSADLVIGAVLVPGALAPHLVSKEQILAMKPGAVVIDISVDQGGCFETSRMTTHSDPTYVVGEVVHYCVGNMPGAVPHTSTYALTNATLSYVLELANKGLLKACLEDPALAKGLNTLNGVVVNGPVAAAHGLEYRPAAEVF